MKEYYIVNQDRREGPFTFEQLKNRGLDPATLVWTAGLPDWVRADSLPELSSILASQILGDNQSAFGGYAQPQVPPVNQGTYGFDRNNYGYDNGAKNSDIWYTLAIIATVLGFLCSCIGGIVGIFGIVNGNNARDARRMGDDFTADSKWQTCRTLTIISFVLSGIGLIGNLYVIANMDKLMSGML